MKKIISATFVFAIFISLYSCNENGNIGKNANANSDSPKTVIKEKITKKDIVFVTADCPGAFNYSIPDNEASNMRTYFKNTFSGLGLNKSFWIDGDIIIKLANVLDQRSDLDGVRFTNAVYSGTSNILAMIPTAPISGCMQTTSTTCHKNVYGSVIPLNPDEFAFKYFNLGNEVTQSISDEFGVVHRKEKKRGDRSSAQRQNLSSSVWVCENVILGLRQEIQNGTADGVTIELAAYNKINPRASGQAYTNQSTIIISSTLGLTASKEHKINLKAIDKNKENEILTTYNHGQLCPTQCGGL